MKLPQSLAEHKTMLAGLIVIARPAAELLAVRLDAPVTQIAQSAEISRQYIYEVAGRLLAALEPIAAAGPGRPPCVAGATNFSAEAELTMTVLRHRVDHPDAVVAGDGRTFYSPPFRRFILELHDQAPVELTLDRFARAVDLPLDTLRDWIAADRQGLLPAAPPRPEPRIPQDASSLVHRIAELFGTWQGTTRHFIAAYAERLGLLATQVRHVLVLVCLIAPRRPRGLPGAPRYRGETQVLSPGAVLVTDGKSVCVELTATRQQVKLNWQAMVDQATGCNTAVVVTDEECARGVTDAFVESMRFLGGQAPDALVHDNKAPYQDSALAQAISPVQMIPTTLGRAENKALLEGAFGKFEQHVGPIKLDDTNRQTLIASALREILRAYCAGVDHAPRAELGGKSRTAYLRQFVRSEEQRRRDLKFLAGLKERHAPNRPARQIDESRHLLDLAFKRIPALRDKDKSGSLRRYLGQCQPAAVRQGLAMLEASLDREALDARYAHRYLRALVVNHQHELDLQRCEIELLQMADQQGQWWTEHLEQEFDRMRAKAATTLDLARAVAEQAAYGGLPVEGAFWSRELDQLVAAEPHLAAPLRTFLVRLYEAPHERRLVLIDRLAALEQQVA